MELAGQMSYRQLAEEIGEVLQAAAETAEKMQEEARSEAARIRADAEAELRTAYAEGRRILDEARMEADMLRAEAEWQTQEVLAQARRQAAERVSGANTRLANLEQAEARVLDRLAGVGQLLADTMATIREGRREAAAAGTDVEIPEIEIPEVPEVTDDGDDGVEQPSAKVYFVEFPPPAAPTPTPTSTPTPAPTPEPVLESDREIVLTETGESLFNDERERSEWAPPPGMPTWWTRGSAQG
jgi:multidrug efflux pump subunit AcrA (membrane-fusion protein)